MAHPPEHAQPSAPSEGPRPTLLGASQQELESLAEQTGQPRYRGQQLFVNVYRRRCHRFEVMSELPKGWRAQLASRFSLARPRLVASQVAQDGTRKLRHVAADGAAFETVFIPEVARGRRTNTLCISSQSGCALGCRFCFTATLGAGRNLTAGEMVGQLLSAEEVTAPLGETGRITNVVFMGMGEPLLNFHAVVKTAELFINPEGLDISSRRVTVSTAGIVPQIKQLGNQVPVQLAVSLNATTDEVRSRIMPVNDRWPLPQLMAALRAYPLPRRRRITIEYVLLGGVNDSLEDAKRLPQLLAGLPVKVNLLPLNPHPRTDLAPPDPQQVKLFQATLRRAGLNAIIRSPRGQEIAAACGRLGGDDLPAVATGGAPNP